MGNSESTSESKEQLRLEEYTLKFWKISNATEFYVWCRSFYGIYGQIEATAISARIYQLLNTFMGPYLIEAFKAGPTDRMWRIPIIDLDSNVPEYNHQRWHLTREEPFIDREKLPNLPFYELDLYINVRSQQTWSFHFETKAEFLTFMNTPKPIEWPNQSVKPQTDDSSKLKQN